MRGHVCVCVCVCVCVVGQGEERECLYLEVRVVTACLGNPVCGSVCVCACLSMHVGRGQALG